MDYLIVALSPKEHKRIFNKIVLDNTTGCWNWTGGKDQQGYGQGFYNHKRERVHRILYAFFKGKIPRGKTMQLDHLCKNVSCCNPEHLELVKPQINGLRSNGFQAMNAKKTHCKYGHPYPEYRMDKPRHYCRICDSIRHKKRMQGPQRDYWLKKSREATFRYYHKSK